MVSQCFRQFGKAVDKTHCRDSAQLARFNLVQTAAVDAPLAAEFVACNLIQKLEYLGTSGRLLLKYAL